MSCQLKNCNCQKYAKKEQYRQAKRKHPLIDNPLDGWQCTEAEEKTCSDFKPYPPPTTEEQFKVRQEEILKDIPLEFRGAIAYLAWEQGHSYGYDEVLIHVHELADNLKEPIKKYRERIFLDSQPQA